ncbi:MAG: prolipoprotein diacylglyceryl transferase [Legionella sp.]|nr:prolipoprotein diacylglyceryl transferase [Legionella sp.]
MFIFPEIDPIAFSLGPIKVHWYGLMYLAGFGGAWLIAYWRVLRFELPWTTNLISDLIFYCAFGVIIGGRLGYMLFYNTSEFFNKPWMILKIWEGGMSFHGGLIGVAVAIWIFARRFNKTYLETADFLAPLVPLGLGLGRIGNFINGELWGRVTDLPWAMVYRHVDAQPRHPSELYELGLEGFALFILVWVYAAVPRKPGAVAGVFLMGYALCRLLAECFREPDAQLNFIAFDWLTMGQLLSIPMLLGGFYLWWNKR